MGLSTSRVRSVSGMINMPSLCCACNQNSFILFAYDINFNLLGDSSSEAHEVCTDCVEDTKKLLLEIKDMEMIYVPLHINHDNIFIREAVKNRLGGKWLCNI